MAIEDYYIDLYYINKIRKPDGTGGYEYFYRIGDKFRGTATKSGSAEQQVAGIRGEMGEQYTITTPKTNKLYANNMIMFINDDGQKVFLRVNSNANYTPKQSYQRNWKYASATKFEPDLEVFE